MRFRMPPTVWVSGRVLKYSNQWRRIDHADSQRYAASQRRRAGRGLGRRERYFEPFEHLRIWSGRRRRQRHGCGRRHGRRGRPRVVAASWHQWDVHVNVFVLSCRTAQHCALPHCCAAWQVLGAPRRCSGGLAVIQGRQPFRTNDRPGCRATAVDHVAEQPSRGSGPDRIVVEGDCPGLG